MPCDIGKKVTRAYAHTIGIPRGAKDQDGAWELIQYLAASEEAATKAFKDVSAMYPWKPWRDKNDWSQMPYAQWFVDHFQTADLLAPPLHPEVFGLIGSEFYNRMDPAVEEVMLGTMKPAEALQRAQDELQPILDKAVKQYGG